MKLNRFLPITILAGVLMLSACGSKGGSSDSENGGDSVDDPTPSTPSTPSGPSYTITETDFLVLKAKLMNPKIFVEGNFTVDLTIEGDTFKNKIANGKDDVYVQGTHFVFDLDVSSYNASTSKASGDTYKYDDEEKTWSKQTGEVDVALYASYSLGFETVFEFSPLSLDSFAYNEDTRLYTGSKTVGDDTCITKFMVKDGQFLSYEIVDVFKYEFSDYGTTTVTLPEVVA